MLLWAFATVVDRGSALGAVGWLTPTATLLVARRAGRRGRPAGARGGHALNRRHREPISRLAISLLFTLIAVFAVQAAGGCRTRRPSSTTRSRITCTSRRRGCTTGASRIVPAVFGDPSPAYAPANVELWFLFLMAPLRSDYLAGVGQLPFAALAIGGDRDGRPRRGRLSGRRARRRAAVRADSRGLGPDADRDDGSRVRGLPARVAAVRDSPVERPPPAAGRPAGGGDRASAWPSERNTRRPRWRCRSCCWPRPRRLRRRPSICAAARSRSRPCSRRAASGTCATPPSPGTPCTRSPSP